MKGHIRKRVNRDATVSYICQVSIGYDPVTRKRRFKTGVAPTQRAANALIHQLLTEADDDR